MVTKKTPKPAVDHGPITEALIARTQAAAEKYKDALIPPVKPKQSKKAAALQALIDAGKFGCHSIRTAEAFSILTGEKILPPAIEPEVACDDQVRGLCIVLHEEMNGYPAGKVLIAYDVRFRQWIRSDTGTAKDNYIRPTLKHFRFATSEEIRAAMSGLSKEKAAILTYALLK